MTCSSACNIYNMFLSIYLYVEIIYWKQIDIYSIPWSWDFLLGSLGCWLKKVQAFLNGDAMVFFQDAICVCVCVCVLCVFYIYLSVISSSTTLFWNEYIWTQWYYYVFQLYNIKTPQTGLSALYIIHPLCLCFWLVWMYKIIITITIK